MTIEDLYKTTKSIYISFSRGKRIKSIKTSEKDIMIYSNMLYSFIQFTKGDIIITSLYVMYKYNPSTYGKFLEHLRHHMIKRTDTFYRFKDTLKNNNMYFNRDIQYLNNKYMTLTTEKLFSLFREGRIQFYTLYELIKTCDLSTIQELELKKISVVVQFLKYNYKYNINFNIENGNCKHTRSAINLF